MPRTLITEKGNPMDLIKMNSIKSSDVVTELLNAELPLAPGKATELTMLNDWEMVLASGGECAPCWG